MKLPIKKATMIKWLVCLSIVTIAYLVNPLVKNLNSERDVLYAHFLDVGQGDSTLLELNGKFMLIDGGPQSSKDELIYYLKCHGVEKLDAVVASHPHEDHIGGLPEVLENFSVDKVYMCDFQAETMIFEEFLKLAADLDTEFISAGYSFEFEGAKLTAVAPNSEKYKEENNYSICLRIDYGSTSYLIMADAEKESEKEILEKGFDIDVDCLRVGHHGSATSSTDEFLSAVSPDISVISVGRNSYGLPKEDTVSRITSISELYRTDLDGCITVSSDGAELEVTYDNS